MSEETKSPAEELVDMVVFGPLGMALEYLENFPHFVDRGRKQAKFARSIGKMAVGGLGGARPAPRAPQATVDTTATEAEPTAAKAKAPAKKAPAKKAKATSVVVDPSSCTAAELIDRVKELDKDALSAVRAAEQAGKNRVTVLRAIDARLSD